MGPTETLLDRNLRAGSPFLRKGSPDVCVIACDDPILTGQLEGALGLQANDAVVLRLPGSGAGLPAELLQRLVARAVLIDKCREVLLLTHSSCAVHRLSANDVLDALAAAGIPRSAVPMDLRELVAAGRDPREAARELADTLRRCPFLPAALVVHVGHLDESTGKISLIENGETLRVKRPQEDVGRVAGYSPGPQVTVAEGLPPLEVPAPAPVPVVVINRPPKPPRAMTGEPDPAVTKALEKIRDFIRTQIPKPERKKMFGELSAAQSRGRSTEDMIRMAMNPIMKSGEKRYQVIDEMVLVKEKTNAMSTDEVAALLLQMVR